MQNISQLFLSFILVNYQTDPNAYSTNQHTMINHLWTSPANANYSVYPINTFPILTPHNSEQYERVFPSSETKTNQRNMVIFEERSLKKVQFSPPVAHAAPLKPLSSAQSWHEISQVPVSAPTTKSVPLKPRSSAPRASISVSILPADHRPVEKPIYIGVDFSATLAERSQTTGPKRRRARSHNHTQQRKSLPAGALVLNLENKLEKPLDSQQSRRISVSPSKLEQTPKVKSTKSRSNHRQQQQLPMGNNQVRPSRNRQQKRSHRSEQFPTQLNNSISNIQSSARPTDTKQSRTPLMRIPLSPLHNQQSGSQTWSSQF